MLRPHGPKHEIHSWNCLKYGVVSAVGTPAPLGRIPTQLPPTWREPCGCFIIMATAPPARYAAGDPPVATLAGPSRDRTAGYGPAALSPRLSLRGYMICRMGLEWKWK